MITGLLVFGLGTGIFSIYLDNRRDKEEAREAARGAGFLPPAGKREGGKGDGGKQVECL